MTQQEWNECEIEADRRMKRTNGHSYLTMLKTRCQHCGRSPKQKGNCSQWFQTYRDDLAQVLRERGFIA